MKEFNADNLPFDSISNEELNREIRYAMWYIAAKSDCICNIFSRRAAIRTALCEVFNRRGIGQLNMCSEAPLIASTTLPPRSTRPPPPPPPPPHSSHPSQELGWRPSVPIYDYTNVLPPPAPYYFRQPEAEGSARLPRYLPPRPYVPYMWGYYDHRLQSPPPSLPPPPPASRLRHYYVPTASAAPATAQTASRRMDRDAEETEFANRFDRLECCLYFI